MSISSDLKPASVPGAHPPLPSSPHRNLHLPLSPPQNPRADASRTQSSGSKWDIEHPSVCCEALPRSPVSPEGLQSSTCGGRCVLIPSAVRPLQHLPWPKRFASPKATCLLSAAAHIHRGKDSVIEEHWFLSDCCVLKTQEIFARDSLLIHFCLFELEASKE